MAEQYPVFNPDRPRTDPMLFVNAATAGINQGNAVPNTIGAIGQGITAAIKGGLQTYQQVQQIEATGLLNDMREIELQRESDPEVQEAKKASILAGAEKEESQAYLARLEADTAAANEELYKKTKAAELQAKYSEATTKLTDMNNMERWAQVSASGDAEQINSMLSDPSLRNTLLRNEEWAMRALSGVKGIAAPEALNPVLGSVDAVRRSKIAEAAMLQEQKLRAERQAELEGKASTAQGVFESIPEWAAFQKNEEKLGKVLDSRKVRILNDSQITVTPEGKLLDDGTGSVAIKPLVEGAPTSGSYTMAYGTNIIKKGLTREEAGRYSNNLDTLNSWRTSTGYFDNVNTDISTDQVDGSFGLREPGPPVPQPGSPQPQAVGTPRPTLSPGVASAVEERKADAQRRAMQRGQEAGWTASVKRGRTFIPQGGNIAPTSQSVPQPTNTSKLTQPAPVPEETVAPPVGKTMSLERLSSVMGGASVELDVPDKAYAHVNKTVYDRIMNTPAMQQVPALIKGLVAVESGGKSDAVSSDGGAGLGQFMEATAEELGLSSEDRLNPDKAVPAISEYMSRLYRSINKEFSVAYKKYQGLAIEPDPRMVLAAYNGGSKYILNGIRAGYLDWEGMKEYLKSVKYPKAAKINTEYGDKVIAASIPFIAGGNASDDTYLKKLMNHGILNVRQRNE
jgi:hypothetical protein